MKNTELDFLEADCLARFGEARGRQIYALTEGIYKTLCGKADHRSSEAIKEHMLTNLYPTMSYYKALREFGYDAEAALAFVKAETAKSAQVKRLRNERLAALPCTYLLYRLFIKSVMKKSFPADGWDTEWICRNAKELHFDFTRCLYKDCCDEENCPELCCVFCANDDISFGGLIPKIRFERSGTLGRGDDRCDFHFIKNT